MDTLISLIIFELERTVSYLIEPPLGFPEQEIKGQESARANRSRKWNIPDIYSGVPIPKTIFSKLPLSLISQWGVLKITLSLFEIFFLTGCNDKARQLSHLPPPPTPRVRSSLASDSGRELVWFGRVWKPRTHWGSPRPFLNGRMCDCPSSCPFTQV